MAGGLESLNVASAAAVILFEAARQRHERNLKAAELFDANRKTRDEITAEENRIKREKQKQSEKQTPQEEPKHTTVYPYWPRHPGMIAPPVMRPPHRPITRPPYMQPPDDHHPIHDRPFGKPPATEHPSQLPLLQR